MRPPRNDNPIPPLPKAGREQRRHGRLRCELLTCTLGEVLDLSASGMKVEHRGRRCRAAVGDQLVLDMRLMQATMSIKARIVRVHQLGRSRYELGLTFSDLDAPTAARLAEIARLARQCRVLGDA